MAMDNINDKFSIKTLLFTRAIPNHVIPVPTNGYKVFTCTDCGDKFIYESSYEHHVNRKSVKITYLCRPCRQVKTFYNRCNLLSHIRSHTFKTATINVVDLKIEPLPLNYYKMNLLFPQNNSTSKRIKTYEKSVRPIMTSTCYECKEEIVSTGSCYKDRANHFMKFTNEVYTCPVCLFALPTECGLKAHIRFHMRIPPYFCPECGYLLPNRNVTYPYNHDCEGFKMMRATTRLQCPVTKTHHFHPNDHKNHMKNNHLKKVFKCPFCVVACFNESTMTKHLKVHKTEMKALILYQCELCPGRLVLQNHMAPHMKNHVNTNVYPCWTCGAVGKNVSELFDHHIKKHSESAEKLKNVLSSITNETDSQDRKQRIYRVVKRCDQCKRSFIYKCKFDEIVVLPNFCPYKCSSNLQSNIESEVEENANNNLICHLCKDHMSQDWEQIKQHYASYHKNIRCLDAKLVLNKLDIKKYLEDNKSTKAGCSNINKKLRLKKQNNISMYDINIIDGPTIPAIDKANNSNICIRCGQNCENKNSLEIHMVTHRDPCMAYQCLECGQSFVVKPTFSKHLLLEHGITNATEYIETKKCYNENALLKYKETVDNNDPINENQCNICREQFENPEDLEKHFRVHGMAFLMKNTPKKKY